MSMNSVEYFEGNKLKMINLFPQNVQVPEAQFKRKLLENFEELNEDNVEDFIEDLVENAIFSESIKENFKLKNGDDKEMSHMVKKYQRLE